MHVSLYRRYRPRLFGEVVGQDAANALLRSSFLEQRLSHAYLFSGPRGCGKTTAARLLAKVVNCQAPTPEGEPCCVCDSCRAVASGEHMDVMEIDGASNRGIDQIRELKSHVGLASFMGGMKVYILDEVHMLTMEAFNALLKTLEEPPSSVMFIFATTEPHKVPVTIRSRCQHIPFHRISTERIVSRLCDIARAEAIAAEDSALWEIARNADGALRDAISLFEQAVALGHGGLGMDSVRALFGGGARAEMERWIVEVREHPDDASASLKSALDLGVSPERFLDGLFPLLRDMWAFSLWGEKSFAGASLSEEEKDFIESEAPQWDSSSLRRCAMACASLFPRARFGLKNDVFSGLLLFELLAATMDVPEAPPR
ncbi:MAG: DNA polymerase III subunit gamma/tau, partial [Synergistaceae bacterium]|nr:DNA polymerase III subunit gamma/tau [Synergistaceae bacterium]